MALLSCKKEDVEPIETEPTDTTAASPDYDLVFVAADYSGMHYTNLELSIDGNLVGDLGTTTKTNDNMTDDYVANSTIATGLTFEAYADSLYSFEIRDKASDTIVTSVNSNVILANNNDFGGQTPLLGTPSWNWNTSYIDPGIGSGIGDGGYEVYYFSIETTLVVIVECEGS